MFSWQVMHGIRASIIFLMTLDFVVMVLGHMVTLGAEGLPLAVVLDNAWLRRALGLPATVQ